MTAIENVNLTDLVNKAENAVIEDRTKATVSFLKKQIERRDNLRTQLQGVEEKIEAIARGDWSRIDLDDSSPSPYWVTGYGINGSSGLACK